MSPSTSKRPNWLPSITTILSYAVGSAAILFALWKSLTLQKKMNLILDVSDFVNSFVDHTEWNTNENLFLLNDYTPVSKENANISLDPISGVMPNDISGLFLRVGPNQLPGHMSRRYHLFDGHGMIHSVRIKNGKAFYSNSYIETPRLKLEREYNRSMFFLFGELIGLIGIMKIAIIQPIIMSLSGYGPLQLGQANTNLVEYNGKVYACHEGSLPFEIGWDDSTRTIRSIGYETFGERLDYPFTAHAKVDPEDNVLYFNGYNVDKIHQMKYGSVNGSTLESYFGISMEHGTSFSHDMMITKNYVLLVESSVKFTEEGIIEGNFFGMKPERNLRIGVGKKRQLDGQDSIVWYEADRAYSLTHALNAWEEVGADGGIEIVVSTPMATSFDGSLQVPPRPTMYELRLSLQFDDELRQEGEDGRRRMINVTALDPELVLEFPRMHPNYIGRNAKFGYFGKMDWSEVQSPFTGIVKYDIRQRRASAVIDFGPGVVAGEPVPIPKKRAPRRNKSRDDSDAVYLAVFTYNLNTSTSDFVIYDGETMSHKPVVRYRMPVRVPFGFHGEWFPETSVLLRPKK